MKKIHVNFMKDLRNHEFAEMYQNIISFIEKQNVDDVTITSAFEQVKSHQKRLHDMRRRKQSSFSIENKKLTRTRCEYISSLRLRVKSYLLSHIPAERKAALEIHTVMEAYSREFYVASIVPQTALVSGLEHKLKNSKKFREAFSMLGLDDLLTVLIDMTIEIMENYSNRINENKETQQSRAGVKEEAYRDMKTMADAINLMAVINKNDKEKMSAIEELVYYINSILKDYRTPMKSRNTKRKNRKAIEAAVQELINLQQKQQKLLPSGETSTRTGTTPPTVVELYERDSGASLCSTNSLIDRVILDNDARMNGEDVSRTNKKKGTRKPIGDGESPPSRE